MSAEPNTSAIFEENQESFSNSPESLANESETSVTDEAKTVTDKAASSEEFSLVGGMTIDFLQEEIDTLKQQLEEQTQQVDAYKKRYISLAAEFDNFRKRTEKEKEELETKTKGKTLMEILDVVDNFEGTVVEQLVRGYTLGEQVLRHALVKVAAPKEADPNADQSEATSIPSQESV